MRNLFGSDEQITKEYFGLNAMFISGGDDQSAISSQIESGAANDSAFEDFMRLFETSVQMGDQLQKLMLERILACKEESSKNYLGQHSGISQREIYDFAKSVLYDQEHAI